MTRLPATQKRVAVESDPTAAQLSDTASAAANNYPPHPTAPSPTTGEPPVRPGTLYLLATPIGNPEDITLRALNVLRQTTLLLAEDSRLARALLQYHAIDCPIISLRPRHAQNAQNALREALQSGKDAALVCDAGTPSLADPGLIFVRHALELGAKVTALPGPSAALTALVVSGLPTGRFVFEGFPPRLPAARANFLQELAAETRTILLYERAVRLRATLADLTRVLGPSRSIALCRDLTKPTEAIFRGTLEEAVHFAGLQRPHGEYTLILAGYSEICGKIGRKKSD